ncbi:MAG: DUF1501 domain-containing protein [Armatimonadota bacterium]
MRSPQQRCDGITRRHLLKIGSLAVPALGLADALRLAHAAPGTGAREVSCILIWLDGGPSHLDTFDLKPDAPSEVRGDFRPIPTRADGVQICEHLPRTAEVMDRVALIRSLTHELGNHDTGSHYLLTGHRPTPAVEHPSLGSVAARESTGARHLPPYVAIPEAVASAGPGYLPGAYAPFSVGGDPSQSGYRVQDLSPPVSLPSARLEERRAMVRALDEFSRRVEAGGATESRDAFFEQAYRLITSPAAKAAFDLSAEPPAAREAYGRSRLGAACLLARRLVEAGTRFVTVVDPGWDTHQQIFKALPDAFFPGSGKLPALDRAYSALLRDLDDRGLLASTLVVLMGEFGRTPKLNSAGGRDHWPRAGSVLLAGAGIRGGQVIGKTDAYGEAPVEQPVRPEDLAHTLLELLGIEPGKEVRTPDGRPMKLVASGRTIPGLR